MNAFTKLVRWQIAILLIAALASFLLNIFPDKHSTTFVLFVVSWILMFISFMTMFTLSPAHGTIIAAVSVVVSVIVTLFDPYYPPITLTPAGVSLMVLAAGINVADYIDDWNILWLGSTLAIEMIGIASVFLLETGSVAWISAVVSNILALALLERLGRQRAIRATFTPA